VGAVRGLRRELAGGRGDIARRSSGEAPQRLPSNQRFLNSDKTVWTFDLHGPGFLPFGIEDLTLETHGFPGSVGYSALVMTAHQNGELIMEWHASVVQGSMPVHGELPGGGETVSATTDRLHIEDLLFEIPVEYDANGSAEVTVTVYFENSGARS